MDQPCSPPAPFLIPPPSLRAWLQDASAHLVRRKLQPFLQEAAGRLLRMETRELAALACPLAAPGLPSTLAISDSALAGEGLRLLGRLVPRPSAP